MVHTLPRPLKRTGLYFKVKEPSLRRFFAGAPRDSYRLQLPNRVWKLVQCPAHYNKVWAADKTGRYCDHRDPQCYSMCVRFAFFNVYADYPEIGRQKMNLLQDCIGTDDIAAWERVTPVEQIVMMLMGLDL